MPRQGRRLDVWCEIEALRGLAVLFSRRHALGRWQILALASRFAGIEDCQSFSSIKVVVVGHGQDEGFVATSLDSFYLKDDRPEPIGAAGDHGTTLLHPGQITAGKDGHDVAADIRPSPGAKPLRHLERVLYHEFLALAKAFTGDELVFHLQVLLNQVLV
jgi:hypothetical protein